MSVDRIRERHFAVTAPRHTCVVVNVTLEELRAGKPRDLGACRYNVVDEQGTVKLAAGCNDQEPDAEPDWIDDVGVLLAELDRVTALADAAVKFRIGSVDVFRIPDREIADVGEPRWSAFDGVNAKAFAERDDAIEHARTFNPSTRTYEVLEDG